jgi:hypothetical protein
MCFFLLRYCCFFSSDEGERTTKSRTATQGTALQNRNPSISARLFKQKKQFAVRPYTYTNPAVRDVSFEHTERPVQPRNKLKRSNLKSFKTMEKERAKERKRLGKRKGEVKGNIRADGEGKGRRE